jgi:hypothetical protein
MRRIAALLPESQQGVYASSDVHAIHPPPPPTS